MIQIMLIKCKPVSSVVFVISAILSDIVEIGSSFVGNIHISSLFGFSFSIFWGISSKTLNKDLQAAKKIKTVQEQIILI